MALLMAGAAQRTPRLLARGIRWGAVALLCLLAQAGAQPRAPNLQQIEAAYILKFASYVEWPAHTFARPADPVVVGVMEDDLLARTLQDAARGKQVEGRPVVVRAQGVGDSVRGLHVLVLPRASHPARRRVMAELDRLPILTIAPPEHGDAAQRGSAMVQLVLENDRLRFDVGLPRRELGLRISALMLTAARRVERVPE